MFGDLGQIAATALFGGGNQPSFSESNSQAVHRLGHHQRELTEARKQYPGATMVEVSTKGGARSVTVTAPTRIPQHPKQETPQ